MITRAEELPEEGHIAYVNLDPRIGREQSGHRPCVILSPSTYHLKTAYMIICPITSNITPYPFKVVLPAGLPVSGAILVDQMKSVDRHARGCKIIGHLPNDVMADVRGLLAALFDLARE